MAVNATSTLPGAQVANLLVRHCMTQKVMHILRVAPPPETREWAETVDGIRRRALCAINDVALDEVQRVVCEAPIANGGLGLIPLAQLPEAAWIGSRLQSAAHDGGLVWNDPTTQEAQADLLTRRGLSLHEALAAAPGADLPHAVRKPQRTIARSIAKKLRADKWGELPPQTRAVMESSAATALDSPLADAPGSSAWLTAPPRGITARTNAEFKIAVKLRLRAPLHDGQYRVCNSYFYFFTTSLRTST